ncbi:uncharacterized protein LOC113341521 isoform X2 [Papaver somniferum]|uniref:uncharacterized protein LOC113341521 isoform X2 n=1 Tax=Papaver somniferum TaxID=3469 RepID=UPI000E6F5B52|nr:uncharacterized protein LOC113341521 isoform X2 [Papaver somniferum]
MYRVERNSWCDFQSDQEKLGFLWICSFTMSALACLTCNCSCFGPYDSFHECFGFRRNVSFTALLDLRAPWYLPGGSMLKETVGAISGIHLQSDQGIP